MKVRFVVLAVIVAGLGLILVACGSSSSSSSGGSTNESNAETTKSSEGPTANADLVPPPSETPPTEIPPLKPLPQPPKEGIKVVNLQCDFTDCAPFAETLKTSADALGWHLKNIVFKTGQPQAAMTSAVNEPNVEYITIPGVPQTIIEPQLKEAGEKGITVISCCDPERPSLPTVPVQISDEHGNSVAPAEAMTDWMINDSEGTARAAVIGLPEIPTTAVIPPAIEKRFADKCPQCSAAEVPVTGEELAAGTVPGKVVAFLQNNPEIDYVAAVSGSLWAGISQAIQNAGLKDHVRLVGMQTLHEDTGKELERGAISAWYASGQGSFGDFMADAIARHSEGLPLPQKIYGEQGQHWLCTPETAAECTEWWGPEGFQEQFEKIWGVG